MDVFVEDMLLRCLVLAVLCYWGVSLLGWSYRQLRPPARMLPTPTCATCALVRGYGDDLGCRAEPPRLMLDGGALHSGWPRVRPGDWCAKHTAL